MGIGGRRSVARLSVDLVVVSLLYTVTSCTPTVVARSIVGVGD